MTPFDPTASRSTVFAKVPPELREQIDQALIDRAPPTYKAVFGKFQLENYNVSFTSFYLYARKIRRNAAIAAKARAAGPITPESSALTAELLETHLQELLMDANPNNLKVKRIADAWRGATWAHLALDTHAAKKQAAAEAARSKVVENALDMCAKLAEDGCIEIHPPDESSPDARPGYVIRTAENAHRAEREAEEVDLQPNSARFPARSEPACPHAGSPSASPRHDPEPLPHQPRREPFRETAHQRKPSQSPATQSGPACPHAGPLPATPRHHPESPPAEPFASGIPASDPAISSKPPILEPSPPPRSSAMKRKPTPINLSARKRTKKFFSALAADHSRFARAVEKTQPGRTQASPHKPSPLRELAPVEPIPFELLQEVVKEVWGIDLPVNFDFENECPLIEPPEEASTNG